MEKFWKEKFITNKRLLFPKSGLQKCAFILSDNLYVFRNYHLPIFV